MRPAGSLLLAIHYQNENCHPDGRIRTGVGAGEVAWRAEVLAATGRLFAGARAHDVTILPWNCLKAPRNRLRGLGNHLAFGGRQDAKAG